MSASYLDLSNTSSQSDVGGGLAWGKTAVSLEGGQSTGVGPNKGTRLSDGVTNTVVAQVGLAGGSTGCEELSWLWAQEGGLDTVEDVALSDDVGVGTNIESMSRVLVEHVVNGVENSLDTCHLGGATGGVVNVVADKGDGILGTVQENGPVVLVIAGCGPGSVTIELAVGNGDASCSCSTAGSCEHLSADEGNLHMVNPDEICAKGLDRITSPDILRVELSNVNVPVNVRG